MDAMTATERDALNRRAQNAIDEHAAGAPNVGDREVALARAVLRYVPPGEAASARLTDAMAVDRPIGFADDAGPCPLSKGW